MRKLKAPEDLTSFSHNNVEIEIPSDGILTVPEDANPQVVEAMLAHGFTELERQEVKTSGRKRMS